MLAMKFLHYQQDHSSLTAGDEVSGGPDKAAAANKGPPGSLFQLAAEMIKVRTTFTLFSWIVA